VVMVRYRGSTMSGGGANVVHRAPAGDKARVACRSMEVAPVTSERSRRRGRPASASRRR